MNRSSFAAIASVAYKEFLHIWRDRRVLALLLILPPVFTLIFGHAFESGERKGVPALLINADPGERTQRFVDLVMANETFAWREQAPQAGSETDLLGKGVRGALIIPQGWSASLTNGEPMPLQMYLDGSDTSTGEQLYGSLRKTLADFQMSERTELIDRLPDEVIQFGKQLPLDVRNEFVSAMEAWDVEDRVLYNPEERFIDYVLPGVIGIILQLITVTLMACTIARERESGTLYQLMVTALRRGEIVIGKMLPYLAISVFLIIVIMLLAGWHFDVKFHQPAALALICLLFLVCSLGLGLLISALSKSQTQAIQFSVFFLLPVFILSGAFAPLEQLPKAIASVAELFPLTHFCRAFRLVNLYHADMSFYVRDLIVMAVGAVVTFGGAAFLLKRIEQ
jgi:ABC-type multidrug transport system permease subunit